MDNSLCPWRHFHISPRSATSTTLQSTTSWRNSISEEKQKLLCVPSYCKDLVETERFHERVDKVLRRHTTLCNPQLLRYILMPIHLQGCHWGLIVISLKVFYFDDGLKCDPPSTKVPHAILGSLQRIFPGNARVTEFTTLCHSKFKRFGMPRQPVNGSVHGSGSCGVGVILAARDFISNLSVHGLPRFQWRFKDSRLYRKQLLLQILKWSGQ